MSEHDPYAALQDRTEENYAKRDGERLFHGFFDPDLTIPLWIADKGEHMVNIIPYRAGTNDPSVEEGTITYILDVRVHRNVGPRDLQFVCMEIYNKSCSICEERNRLRKNPPESERAQDPYKKKLSELKPSRRAVYNIECVDSNDEMDKGIQVWEVAHWFMERHLLAQAKLPKAEGGGYTIFTHPDEGKIVFFERTGVGAQKTDYTGHKFRDRRESIPQDLLDDVFVLDGLLYLPSYEEVKSAFWDEHGEDEQKSNEEEEQLPQRKRRVRTVEEEPAREDGPAKEDEEVPFRRSHRTQAETDEEQPRRRPARARTEDVRDEPSQDTSSGGRMKRLGTDDEELKCPVPKGTFGQDAGTFDDCDDCDIWTDCVKRTHEHRKSRRK